MTMVLNSGANVRKRAAPDVRFPAEEASFWGLGSRNSRVEGLGVLGFRVYEGFSVGAWGFRVSFGLGFRRGSP